MLSESFIFKSSKTGHYWAKLRRVKMACTFLLNSALFFRFKNWCKITSRKKSSLTSALGCTGQGVKLPFLSKKCVFRAEKGIFSKSSFYTKMFSDPKYSFSVCPKIFFLFQSKVNIFHQIQPTHITFQFAVSIPNIKHRLHVCLGVRQPVRSLPDLLRARVD